MIKTFADKETEKIFNQQFSKKLPENIQTTALRKLIMIANAEKIDDLRIPPSNRLEKLQGDRKDQFCIRINNQWRICFNFANGDSYNVKIVDYH